MRSRPTLEVHYSPRHPRPGDRIHFEARLVARTDTPIDNAIFRFRGREKRLHHPMGKTVVSLEHVHLDMMAEGGEDVLRAGETRVLPFEFDLPLTLPPSYRSALSSIEYVLESRIDIPWWPDRTANYAIRVWPAPQKQKKARSAFVATSPRGPVGKELHMELTLDGTTLELGGEVSGAILLENVRHHTVRRLQLAAVLMDAPVDSGSSFGPREVFRSEPMVLATNPPQSGRPYPFSLRLPSGVVPSFTGRQVQVRWYLEARAVIAFGRDVVLSAGLHVSQPFEGDEPVEAPTKTKTHAPRSGPMGRERRALVWAEVARSAGLTSEGEGETMTGSVGPVQVTVMLELRGDVLHSVGILKWPALGLGLEVAERRWSDAFGAAVPLNDEPFDKRFTVHCRPGASVREVLDREVREQLLSFERISVEDEGAELTTVGNGYTVTELGAFVRGVLLTATELAEAFTNVAPHPSLRPQVEAWRALATKLEGQLRLGDFSIRGARYREAPVELVTRFGSSGAPISTVARALLDGPKEPNAESLRVMAGLLAECQGLKIAQDAVEATLPCPLVDPSKAESLWRGLARLVKALQ